MTKKNLYEKLKHILNYIEYESNKPIDNHNYETRLWSKGYKKAMVTIKSFLLNILNKDN